MLISDPMKAAAWKQAVAREMKKPVFPRLPSALRPYLLALALFAAATSLLYVGDAALLRYGLPWTLVSLLIIVAAATLWGARPAMLVLALSALFGVLVVPHLAPPPLSRHPPAYVLAIRTTLFVACGAATVWLTDRARQMQERAERRRGVVTALQSMILPDALPEAPGYDLCGLYRPAHHEEEVGGDFYDFYPIRPGLYGVLIGDVMGKGKEAAASTALLRYTVRAFAGSGVSPAQIMERLNTLIEMQGLKFGTASLFLGCLDAGCGSFRYASAGHEPPLLRRAGGGEETLGATGPVLGVGLGMTYEEETVVLAQGDALLLMTDGVTEARDRHGRFLECEGAWAMLRAALTAPSAHKAVTSLDEALMTYVGPRRSDDIAMLLLWRGSEPADATMDSANPLRNVRAGSVGTTRTAAMTAGRETDNRNQASHGKAGRWLRL